jgi:hypothetical protein
LAVTTDRIDIICDDRRHERGKKAKVVSFTFASSIGAWVGPFYVRRGRLVPAPPHGYRASDAELPTPFRPNVVGQRGPVSQQYPCGFCRQKLECSDETLEWLLNTVAALGESTVSLKRLNVLVSERA